MVSLLFKSMKGLTLVLVCSTILVFCLLPLHAQQLVDKFIVDDFTVDQACILVLQNDVMAGDPFVFINTTQTGPSNSIIGGERDMETKVFEGLIGRLFISNIYATPTGDFDGEWSVGTPSFSSSTSTIQYDGPDDSLMLELNGLNLNLTEVTQITLYANTDLDVDLDIVFYDTNGLSCSGSIPITHVVQYMYTIEATKRSINISSFTGNCNFETIGAIEFSVTSNSASIDMLVRQITLDGPLPPNISPTPTPTPTPSPSMQLQLVEKYLIDDFTVTQQILVILPNTVLSTDPNFVETTTQQGSTNSIIGGERDMEMRVFEGSQGRLVYSGVYLTPYQYFQGQWAVDNSFSTISMATNQYDGIDGSFNLTLNSLNIDLSDSTHMKIIAYSSLPTSFFIDFYDFNGNICSGSIPVGPVDDIYYNFNGDMDRYLILSTLVGNCDTTSIGAIEVSVSSSTSIDIISRKITIEGPLPPNISPTPTPTRTPSPSMQLQLAEKYLIDDFTVPQQCVVILQTDVFSPAPNVVETTTQQGSTNSIIGGERDMEMRVFEGSLGGRFGSEVYFTPDQYFQGQWAVQNPGSSIGVATNQYDGIDGSFNLNFNGLNINLNEATHMKIYAISDQDGEFDVYFFDFNGNICTGSIPIDNANTYGDDEIKIYLLLSSLTGNCNRENIGAIEITSPSQSSIDLSIFRMSLDGPIITTLTLTTTPTITPSSMFQIITPSISPSPTTSTSPSISPSPSTSPSNSGSISFSSTPTSFNSENLVHPILISASSISRQPSFTQIGSQSNTISPNLQLNRNEFPIIVPTSIPVTTGTIQIVDVQGNTVVTLEFENIDNSDLMLTAGPGITSGEFGSNVIDSSLISIVLTDDFGSEVQPSNEVELCFLKSKDINDVDDACLGFLNEDLTVPRWECVDRSIREKGDFLCGTTDHFTNFAILFTGGGNDDDESIFIFNESWKDGVLIGSLSLAIIIFLIIGALLLAFTPAGDKILRGDEGSRVKKLRELSSSGVFYE